MVKKRTLKNRKIYTTGYYLGVQDSGLYKACGGAECVGGTAAGDRQRPASHQISTTNREKWYIQSDQLNMDVFSGTL